MTAVHYDPERSWRETEKTAGGINAAELALDVLDIILDILDAVF